MRPCDIDHSDKVWVYQPQEHKTAHHGLQRRIYLGPKAQKVLAPFLLRDPQTYCLAPRPSYDIWAKVHPQSFWLLNRARLLAEEFKYT